MNLRIILSSLFLAYAASCGSLLNSLNEPLTQVQIYSATEEIEKILKDGNGNNVILPTKLIVTNEDIKACQQKCKTSTGIYAQGIDCSEGCTPAAIEKAILTAAERERNRLKTVKVE